MKYLSVLLLVTGAVFLAIENTYYQYLDEDGFLIESWFMPLGWLSLIVGFLLLVIVIIKKLQR